MHQARTEDASELFLLPKQFQEPMAYSFRFKRPKQAGVLIKEKVRCGKAHCFCSKRERFHEAWAIYYRDYRRADKKLKKKYVPKAEVWAERFMMELAKLTDKRLTLTLQQRLVKMHWAMSEPYDYESDWRTWVMRSDLRDETKQKMLNDELILIG